MSRSKSKPVFKELTITDLAAEGKAIARYEGMVVFVSNCVPGDIVDVQIIRKRKRYMEGYPLRFHSYSGDRVQPFCSHFGTCGGCKWQHLPYAMQLKLKQQQVIDAFERIGKVEPGLLLPIISSTHDKCYRNKLEFTFSHHRWLTNDEIKSDENIAERRALGFHVPGKFDKVLDIQTCYLQPEPSNEIRNFVKSFACEQNLPFFNLLNHEGFLRNVILRNNLAGEFMAVFSFFSEETDKIDLLLNAVLQKFPQIRSLYYVINSKANDTIHDLDMHLFHGDPCLTEKLEDLTFLISPKSFFQTNTRQALALYNVVRDFASLSPNEILYDLYTGTGTIALFLARLSKYVVGLEFVPEAVHDAVFNAQRNQIGNVDFLAGDIRVMMDDSFFARYGYPDVIVTDPPRTGMHAGVVEAIIKAAPKRIVYVSCNPATQARDVLLLSEKYVVKKTQPVDMFPQTHHVENVALLEAI
jgi:23S rRNA (uracil1939-C5)-methyltransferase